VGDHEVVVHLGYAVKSTVKVKISGKTEEGDGGGEKSTKVRRPRKTDSGEEKAAKEKKA
jgi:hypothetical protein